MDRIITVVFDNEAKAFEGKTALLDLNREGTISIYGSAVVAKKADGSSTVKQIDEDFPLGTLAGTTLGTLIGVLGGPAGIVVGATAGLFGGLTVDLHNYRIADDYVEDVIKALAPGKVAVVAEVEEDWTTPVDSRMESLGGIVLRRSLSEVKDTIHKEDVAAIKADIAQLKAEQATANADRKKKVAEKINQLDLKLQAKLQKANERRLAAEHEAQVKAELLRTKAAAMRAGVSA